MSSLYIFFIELLHGDKNNGKQCQRVLDQLYLQKKIQFTKVYTMSYIVLIIYIIQL